MLSNFGKFIVAYLLFLMWLFNVDPSDSLLCSKPKPNVNDGNINITCHNPLAPVQVYDFKYNKNVKLDDIKLRKILKAEEFGIYIVGYGDTDIARDLAYIEMAHMWGYGKKAAVCLVAHTDLSFAISNLIKYRLPYVGDIVGHFLLFLEKQKIISIRKTIGAGFSIGAHMIGKALKYVFNQAKVKAPLLIGLDPVRLVKPPNRLSKEDADYVQVLNSSIISEPTKLGHANFDLNGKKTQPGCHYYDVECRHTYAMVVFCRTVYISEQIIGTDKNDPKKTCLFGIHNVQKEYGDFDIYYDKPALKKAKT